ncbi:MULTISPECIES: TetR/AcrR family transcriptional regulator [Rhodococcus]|uniref:TetR/AcrR family transcriptional regulator n=1 Tax=Rhodococcus TaxID=1827 RepID=UPI000575C888|nr:MULTISPECIES: TetR/AcrR family transcriptional regulator [Rhodococcus]KHJ71561.1 TetR family transcriptional regulator [Rhodococcus sp. Chr-9]UPK63506.1 TetR/AcrR family transcriptional regulator [Rhodococcus pyridinivorans]
MTTKGARTRTRMIDTALELIQTRGYHGTGLAHITAGAAAPRGSLYFHFPGGKDELVVAALDRVGAEFTGLLESLIADGRGAGAVVSAVFDDLAARLERSDFAAGCAVASVAVDAAAENPALQESCARVYESWRVVLEQLLVRDGVPNPAALAGAIVGLVEGATVVARARRDTAPLHEAKAVVLDLIGASR